MPVVAAIPLLVSAGAAAAGATATTALAAGAIAGTVASTAYAVSSSQRAASDAKNAANQAASNTQAVADYNARVDRAQEAQVALDSSANIRAMRRDAATYLSRQTAGLAGSGIRVDSGSPLAVRVATAGQLALRQAEEHRRASARMEGLESSARAGLLESADRADAYRIEGQSKADAYHRAGTAALIGGASRLLSQGWGFYQGGAFSPEAPKLEPLDRSLIPKPTPLNTGGFDSPTWAGGYA